jgi:hypothetical protein
MHIEMDLDKLPLDELADDSDFADIVWPPSAAPPEPTKLRAPRVMMLGASGEPAPKIEIFRIDSNDGDQTRRVLHISFPDGKRLVLIDHLDLVQRF